MTNLPLGITLGEPAGIGPEISLKSWHYLRYSKQSFFAIGPKAHYLTLAKSLNINTPICSISAPEEVPDIFSTAFPVLDTGEHIEYQLGIVDNSNAPAIIESIKTGVNLVKSNKASAIVTSPIQKESLYKAGFNFPGHTEFIADLDRTRDPVMMLMSPTLRVIPITVHIKFRDIPNELKTVNIIKKVKIAADRLPQLLNIEKPRFAIAGLNPHAGEGGSIGDEEIKIINPAILKLRDFGIHAFGPISPDALFTADMRSTYDVAVCMYHDQALIPIKAIEKDATVNVTLGLQFIRTSPDHGTAIDIATQGIARCNSMVNAIQIAGKMVDKLSDASK